MGVKKSLLDLTNAMLALQSLLKTRVMTASTREQVTQTLNMLHREADEVVQNQENDQQSLDGDSAAAA